MNFATYTILICLGVYNFVMLALIYEQLTRKKS
jgi:hypothetical protein